LFTFAGGNAIDLTGPFEVFAAANRCPNLVDVADAAGPPPYDIEIVTDRPGRVRMHSGLEVFAERRFDQVTRGIDTLIVCGGDVRAVVRDERVLAWLRRMYPRVRRLASVCTGSFLLAAAGLLDGRRATTHWNSADLLARRFPRVTVDPDPLFVRDGKVYTSAGVTAGMDLALALVEEDLGRDVALWVARQLVLFLKRPGGQSQFSSHLAAQAVAPGLLGDVPGWIVEHLDADLSVEALARHAGMSPRNFARVFARTSGVTPAKFVERARVEQARRLLEETPSTIDEVASTCGFGNAERMRRTFLRHLRVAPHDYRKRFESQRRELPRRQAS